MHWQIGKGDWNAGNEEAQRGALRELILTLLLCMCVCLYAGIWQSFSGFAVNVRKVSLNVWYFGGSLILNIHDCSARVELLGERIRFYIDRVRNML